MNNQFVLSIFPGIDLLGRGFESEGFCVVRGPDLLWGQSITDFQVVSSKFDGVIAGSPCQDFSSLRRSPATGNGERMLKEFIRIVTDSGCSWFLLENVSRVPDISIPGYSIQRFDLNARECGLNQSRLRHFQFGHRDKLVISLERKPAARSLEKICTATEGQRKDRRTWREFCSLQGLPTDFELPGWSLAAKYRAVGNGVPIPMARVIARAIKGARPLTSSEKLCLCSCGRIIDGSGSRGPERVLATPACKKRMQIRRDRLRVTRRGLSMPAGSPVTGDSEPVILPG